MTKVICEKAKSGECNALARECMHVHPHNRYWPNGKNCTHVEDCPDEGTCKCVPVTGEEKTK